MDPQWLYKVLPIAEWEAAKRIGAFQGSGIDLSDGFIHLSSAEQLQETIEKHFAGQTNLVVIGVDPDPLGETLKWEVSRGGAMFPHVYGEIPVSAVRTSNLL